MDNNVSTWGRIKDSDIYHSFIKSPTAIVSSMILFIIFFCSFFVELITPYNPFDPSSLSLMEAFTPPSWTEDGLAKFILGTDGQGRDMLSTILYGSRISLIVGFSAIIFSLILGVGLGLTGGYFGGKYEMIVMRLTDVQLTVPSILMALLVDGIARGLITREMHDEMAIYVLIFAIGISEWPQFARVSRAATLVEKNKDYVSASTIIGVSNLIIMFKHIFDTGLQGHGRAGATGAGAAHFQKDNAVLKTVKNNIAAILRHCRADAGFQQLLDLRCHFIIIFVDFIAAGRHFLLFHLCCQNRQAVAEMLQQACQNLRLDHIPVEILRLGNTDKIRTQKDPLDPVNAEKARRQG